MYSPITQRSIFSGFLVRLPWLVACVLLGVSGVVMTGWVIDNRSIIQLMPGLAPMQFNTALGFALCGLALLGLVLQRGLLTSFSVVALLLLGGLTAYQYLAFTSIGIDDLFMQSDAVGKTTHAGRMSPATCFCFILIALALGVSRRRAPCSYGLAGMVGLLCLLALLMTALQAEGLYGLASLSRMAVHTAGCFLLVAIGLSAWVNHQHRHRLDFWQTSPIMVLIMLSSLTVFATSVAYESTIHQTRQQFQLLVQERVSQIEKRFLLYQQGLRGAVGFVRGSEAVTREEWREYAASLDLSHYMPGTNGIGLIVPVRRENKQDYLETARADGKPDFTIHPSTQQEELFVIQYIEPETTNREAIGLDIAFEARRRAAAIRARDTGEIALTETIFLVQDKQSMAGFLLLAPVYALGAPTETVAQRREAFLAWAYMPFMARRIMADVVRRENDPLTFEVFDGARAEGEASIYHSTLPVTTNPRLSHLQRTTSLPFGGLYWTIEWRPSENYAANVDEDFPLLILMLGGSCSLVIAFLMGVLSRYYRRSLRHLNEHRQTLSSIFDHAAEGIVSANARGDIEQINRAAQQMLAVKEGQRANLWQLLTQQPFEAQAGCSMMDLSGKHTLRDPSGELRYLTVSLSQTPVAERMLYTAIIHDSTQHTLALEALRESEAFLQLMMDHIPDMVFVKDAAFRLVSANKAFLALYPPETRDQVIGSSTVEAYRDEEAEAFLAMDRKAFAEGYSATKETITFPDGMTRTLFTQKIRFENSQGDAFILGMGHDITEAERMAVMKDEFISTVNHELRTPLSAIQGSLSVLRSRFTDQGNTKEMRMIELAYANCERLSRLVDDILDIEKMAAGKMVYQRAITDMNTLIYAVVQQHEVYAAQHDITIHTVLPDTRHYCLIDPDRFTQALVNLLSNAVKFSPAGQQVRVTLAEETPNRIRIAVQDFGEGIPESFHSKLFDKFTQADGSTTRRAEGTGLGLNIAKSIIEAFDGTITFETSAQGTTFFIHLPACEAVSKDHEPS